jgi:hypothetical protein
MDRANDAKMLKFRNEANAPRYCSIDCEKFTGTESLRFVLAQRIY